MGNSSSKSSDIILTDGNHSDFPVALIKSKVTRSEKVKAVKIDRNSLINLEGIQIFTNLTHLSLKMNKIRSLPKELALLQSLKAIYLDDNLLQSLPQWLAELDGLEVLSVKGNRLTKLPEFSKLSSLLKLNISRNEIQVISSSILRLHHLQSLNAKYNKIVEIPKGLNHLKSLRKLLLQNNRITEIHNDLSLCPVLAILDLSYNKLEYLPENFGNLYVLEKLSVRNNNLKELPHSIGSLQSLRYLNLNENRNLRRLPEESMRHLCKLSKLHAKNCGLLGFFSYCGMGNLTFSIEEIYLDYNELSDIPKDLGQCLKLKHLHMEGNRIVKFPGTFFRRMSNLETINLASNQISHVSDNLKDAIELRRLNLNDNPIYELPSSVLELKKLKKVFLNGKIPTLQVYQVISGKDKKITVYREGKFFEPLSLKEISMRAMYREESCRGSNSLELFQRHQTLLRECLKSGAAKDDDNDGKVCDKDLTSSSSSSPSSTSSERQLLPTILSEWQDAAVSCKCCGQMHCESFSFHTRQRTDHEAIGDQGLLISYRFCTIECLKVSLGQGEAFFSMISNKSR